MDLNLLETMLISILRGAVPLLLLGAGIIISERAGILNLGQEGMLTVGAVAAFATMFGTGSVVLAVAAATLAAMLLALLFALPVLLLRTDQVASGLALTLAGLGIGALMGSRYTGETLQTTNILATPSFLNALLGPSGLVVLGLLICPLLAWFLRTRPGRLLYACGHDPQVVSYMGYSTLRIQLAATLTGGALAGTAGAYLAIDYTPIWSPEIGGGRGWIALALVVFASRMAGRLFGGALLFGSAGFLQLLLQANGVSVSSHFLAALPYLITLIALVVLARNKTPNPMTTPPRSLGQLP